MYAEEQRDLRHCTGCGAPLPPRQPSKRGRFEGNVSNRCDDCRLKISQAQNREASKKSRQKAKLLHREPSYVLEHPDLSPDERRLCRHFLEGGEVRLSARAIKMMKRHLIASRAKAASYHRTLLARLAAMA